MKPYKPQTRTEVRREFNRLNGSANIKHVSESAKQEINKAVHILLGVGKGMWMGQLKEGVI